MNVNDLNRTGPKVVITQPGVTPAQNTQPININAAGGTVTGIADENQNPNRQTIKINPNRKRVHRTVESADQIQEINPNDYIEPVNKPEPKPIQEKYINELANAVTRRKQEFHEAIAKMEEEDAANRESIENGLENVGDEIQYMPNPLYTPMSEDDKIKAPINTDNGIVSEDLDDDFEDSDYDESEEVEEPTHVVIHNQDIEEDNNPHPFAHIVEEESAPEEENTEDETVADDVEEDSAVKSEDAEIPATEDNKNDTLNSMDNNISHVTSDDLEDIDDNDFEESDDEDEGSRTDPIDDEESEKLVDVAMANLRNDIMKKIVNTGRKVNASQLVVSNKVINIKDVLKNTKPAAVKTATWPLMYANRPYIASSLKGAEVALLAEQDNNSNTVLTTTQARIIFEHDVNPYRPATLEAWAKTIPFGDLDSIFMALYVASLEGANYVPYTCDNDHCQYAWLSDDLPVDKMVKFGNDDVKKKFESIKNMELTPDNSGAYESVVTVINDRFAVGIKMPSLFTIMYEYGALDDAFIRKYESIISVIRFIDRIYMIGDDGNLYPVGWKKYPGDHAKTFKSKIAAYSKILKEFNTVEFSIVASLINAAVIKANADIEYVMPETNCPKCGNKVAESTVNPRGMLFTRQQLVRIATTYTEK